MVRAHLFLRKSIQSEVYFICAFGFFIHRFGCCDKKSIFRHFAGLKKILVNRACPECHYFSKVALSEMNGFKQPGLHAFRRRGRLLGGSQHGQGLDGFCFLTLPFLSRGEGGFDINRGLVFDLGRCRYFLEVGGCGKILRMGFAVILIVIQ